jgi:hypothetical protein
MVPQLCCRGILESCLTQTVTTRKPLKLLGGYIANVSATLHRIADVSAMLHEIANVSVMLNEIADVSAMLAMS